MSFHVTLLSNTEKDSHPSDFSCRLPKTLNLTKGCYEVGLNQIIMNGSMMSVSEQQALQIVYRDGSKARITLPVGDYRSIDSLISTINKLPEIRERKRRSALETIPEVDELKPGSVKVDVPEPPAKPTIIPTKPPVTQTPPITTEIPVVEELKPGSVKVDAPAPTPTAIIPPPPTTPEVPVVEKLKPGSMKVDAPAPTPSPKPTIPTKPPVTQPPPTTPEVPVVEKLKPGSMKVDVPESIPSTAKPTIIPTKPPVTQPPPTTPEVPVVEELKPGSVKVDVPEPSAKPTIIPTKPPVTQPPPTTPEVPVVEKLKPGSMKVDVPESTPSTAKPTIIPTKPPTTPEIPVVEKLKPGSMKVDAPELTVPPATQPPPTTPEIPIVEKLKPGSMKVDVPEPLAKPTVTIPTVVQLKPGSRPAEESSDDWRNVFRPGKLTSALTLNFNPVLGRVAAFLREDVQSVTLTEDVAYMLGFSKESLVSDSIAPAPADVTNGRGLLMCYASICDFTICGNRQVNLLRSFIYSNKETSFSQEFLHTRFVPVREHQIDTISIKILDSLGRKIPFAGVVVATLEFKRV